MVIKPSGVEYNKLRPEDMVAVHLDTGKTIGEGLNPSSDTFTHLELYRAFKDIGGIVHTHSPNATSWVQAGRSLPAYGTTHADYFYGEIPCTRMMTDEEIQSDYEKNTGEIIVETLTNLDPLAMRAALVYGHDPFVWGESPEQAIENAIVLE